MADRTDPGSFRDPSGFVFGRDGEILRQVNHAYRDDYDRLMSSGLYDALADAGLLVRHEEIDLAAAPRPDIAYKVVRPERIPFVRRDDILPLRAHAVPPRG